MTAAILDDALESSRLQPYLPQKHPIRVIDLGEGKVASPTGYLTNHPLNRDSVFGGVVGLLPRHLHKKDLNRTLDITC
jgi:hypothetical protein